MQQAFNIADKSGLTDIGQFLSEDPSGSLADLPNVLSQVIRTEPEAVCAMRSASTSVQRAAVITFQTWTIRKPDLVGVLYGAATKTKAWKACRIVVGRSFDEIMSSSKTSEMCKCDQVQPLGIAIAGRETALETIISARKAGEACADGNLLTPLCVFAP